VYHILLFDELRIRRLLTQRTGRAAAIAANKKSFDLCDDSEGLGVGKVLSDPVSQRLFGYIPDEEPKKAEESKENGVAAEAAPATAAVEHKENGVTAEEKVPSVVEAHKTELPQTIPKEVANTA
jgi:hypothetical protein